MYVLESEGVVHVCVELLQGSGCQRPIVLRVNTRKHSDATFPANSECRHGVRCLGGGVMRGHTWSAIKRSK